MDTIPPRRRRVTAQSMATTTRAKKHVTLGGLLIIVLITIVGGAASYFWLQDQQQQADSIVKTARTKADAATTAYSQLIARISADNEYREYALAASTRSITNGTLPDNSSIKLLSEHRDPSKIDVVVDKQHPIYPLLFVPETTTVYCNGSPATVSLQTADAFSDLCSAATAAGLNLRVTSSYRSYQDQMATYAYWVTTDSLAAAETYSARPGYSEHQTGTTIDFAVVDGPVLSNFCGTAEQLWLANNAHNYGFIQRYTVENQPVTGFSAECWHYRYVGTDVAKTYVESNTRSLEDFWGMRGGSYTEVFRG